VLGSRTEGLCVMDHVDMNNPRFSLCRVGFFVFDLNRLWDLGGDCGSGEKGELFDTKWTVRFYS
jgi:hypothetical protein